MLGSVRLIHLLWSSQSQLNPQDDIPVPTSAAAAAAAKGTPILTLISPTHAGKLLSVRSCSASSLPLHLSSSSASRSVSPSSLASYVQPATATTDPFSIIQQRRQRRSRQSSTADSLALGDFDSSVPSTSPYSNTSSGRSSLPRTPNTPLTPISLVHHKEQQESHEQEAESLLEHQIEELSIMKSSKSKVHPSTMPSKLTAKAPATTSHIATNIPATPAKSTTAKANNASVSAKAVSPDTSVKMAPQEQKKTQNEKVSMKQSKQSPEIAAYQFEWKHGGNDVKITGTFDSWEKHLNMKKSPTNPGHFYLPVDLDQSKKTLFKFIVDGEWRCTDQFGTEYDSSGNLNNVLPAAH